MTTGVVHRTAADSTFSSQGSGEWNKAHDINETGGATLDIGAIPDGQFLKRSGTSVIGGTPSGNTDILAASAPNSDFDLTNGGSGGAVTILSKSITGIAAGDSVVVDIFYTILNNSTASRTYSLTGNFGSMAITGAESAAIVNSASSRSPRKVTLVLGVSAANLAYALINATAAAITAAGAVGPFGANVSAQGWNSTSSDLTGSQTISFQVSSSATTATQTLTLHSYTIRKIASNP